MNNLDIDSGRNESKNIAGKKRLNINNLIQRAVIERFGKGGMMDPSMYPLRGKKQQFINEIKSTIKTIYQDEKWDETSDEDISNIKDIAILTEIELFGSGLKQARIKTEQRLYRNFKYLRDTLSREEMSKSLESQDENALSDLYSSRANMKKFLNQEFNISSEMLQVDLSEWRKLMDMDTLKGENISLYRKIEQAYTEYENMGRNISTNLLGEIFQYYTLPAKRRDICEYFDISISLKAAQKYDIIDDGDIDRIVENRFGEVWGELDASEKEKLRATILSNNTELMLDDLDKGRWGEFLGKEGNEKVLASYVSQTISESEGKNLPGTHTDWIQRWRETSAITSKISNIGSWDIGRILVFEDKNGMPHYFQMDATDKEIGSIPNTGVTLSSLEGLTAGTVGLPKGASDITYEQLEDYLKEGVKEGVILSQEELEQRITKDKDNAIDEGGVLSLKGDEKVLDVRNLEDMTTIEALTDAINRIDPEGQKINNGQIGIGLAFVSKSAPDEDGVSEEGIYTIKGLNNGYITISGSGEGDEIISYNDFIDAIDKQGLKRIALLSPENEDEAMINALGMYGVDIDHTKIEKGELITETEEHTDDGHGHKKTVNALGKYEYFAAETGGHIRIDSFENGIVTFGEYSSTTEFSEVKKIHKSKKLSEGKNDSLYSWESMSYGAFLRYLEKNKLKATTNNLLDPDAGNAHDPHEHFETSFFSKLGKMYSINDIIKGVSNLSHHIEHYFEKTSKLNASRVTLGLAKKLGLPADIIAQAQSEEVSSVKEIIEKLKDKLSNLNGPHGRTKALHIAHNKDARPEEVAAAMLHMVRGYGQLYAEDIAYAQGSYSFLNGFLNACGFTTEAERKEMRQKAKDKFLSDMGNEGGEPTEEEMIWGFMKTMDGKYETYPIAGTVVKAMGGPGGWEKAWRTEGFDGAYEKGLRQGRDTVNAKGRVNKGISSLVTHEYNSSIGFLEAAAEKSADPSIQTIPVLWALTGYSQYIGAKGSQKVKSYGDSKGHTFHAYAFLRTEEDNHLFRDTFRIALEDFAPQELEKFDTNIALVQRKTHHGPDDNDKVKRAFSELANIWDKHYDHGIHDALQGRSSWLVEKADAGNKTVKKYLHQMNSMHMLNSGANPPPDNGWMDQFGYKDSPLLDQKNLDGKTVLSLERTLKKIQINAHNYDLDKDRKDRLWPSVLERIESVREIKDISLRNAQYAQYRADILVWLRNAINTRSGDEESVINNLKKKSYYTDLLRMGIDPRIIITNGETEKVIRTTSNEDYSMWNGGGRGTGNHNYETVEEIISDTSDKARNKIYQQGVGVSNTSYNSEVNANKTNTGYILQSEDSDN